MPARTSNGQNRHEQTRLIKTIKVGRRHRKDLGDLDALAESLETVGLLHPVVIDAKNRLIAGQRRLQAAKLLGWKRVPVRVIDLDALTLGEFTENTCRKDFTPSEIAAIARVVRPLEEEKAHRRRLAGLRNVVVENCHDGTPGKSRDIVARFTGISGRTLDKITAIVDAAEDNPARYGHLKEEIDAEPRAVHRCYQKLRLLRSQLAVLAEEIEPVPVGRYQLRENEIVCGDCRQILPRIRQHIFHAVITDPAYGIGQVYNGRQEVADDPLSYWRWFEPIYREILRVLKPGGFCAIFQTGRYLRYFWDWFGAQAFTVYAAIRPITARKGGQPITCCWEPVILSYQGKPVYRSAEFLRSRNWFLSNANFDELAKCHPCPEPLDQCEELIRSFTCQGALVLDPLCGVGSVPIAAARYGRRYLGIELEPAYVRIARTRMKQLGSKGGG